MEKQEILSKVDHTLLKQTATWEQIKVICDEGAENQTASVCIPPCFVKQAKEYVGDKVAVYFTGEILEIYPAIVKDVQAIVLLEPADRSENEVG